jgi:hypothetical protein
VRRRGSFLSLFVRSLILFLFAWGCSGLGLTFAQAEGLPGLVVGGLFAACALVFALLGLREIWQIAKQLGFPKLVMMLLSLFGLLTLIVASINWGGGVSPAQQLVWASKRVASGSLEAIAGVLAYVVRVPIALRASYTGQPLPVRQPQLFPRALPTPIQANQLPPSWPTPLP